MKDWFFYPLVTLIVAGMITYALSFGGPVSIDADDGFVIEKDGLTTLTNSPGTNLSIASEADNPNAYAVFAAQTARDLAPPSAGIFATLSPQYEKAFAGQNIRISISARKGRSDPLDEFDIGYFTFGAGDSGWKTFPLEQDFKTYSFTFKPNLPQGDPASDFVGVWPDVQGRNRTMDVEWIKVEIVKDAG